MKSLLTSFFIILLISSCGESYDTQAEMDKVMAIHDEVMPKMGEMMKLKKQLLDKTAVLNDSVEIEQYRELAQHLDEAQNSMMVWMRQWSKSANPHIEEKTDIESRKAFFASQMEKATQVKNDINSSINKAESALR